MITFTRVVAFTILPLLLATVHIWWDKEANTRTRRIEVFFLYFLATAVGANGVSAFFGHVFLSDIVAESIGWAAGSPFQLEMGFANLTLGVLGFMAMGRRTEFRLATVIAVAVLGLGATIVHLQDIIATGNLAPGNTIQNIGNVLRPTVLIVLLWLNGRQPMETAGWEAFQPWQRRPAIIASQAAAGIATGFGVGFWLGMPLLLTIVGALCGVLIGARLSRSRPSTEPTLA